VTRRDAVSCTVLALDTLWSLVWIDAENNSKSAINTSFTTAVQVFSVYAYIYVMSFILYADYSSSTCVDLKLRVLIIMHTNSIHKYESICVCISPLQGGG
jgi:hypothetical protein